MIFTPNEWLTAPPKQRRDLFRPDDREILPKTERLVNIFTLKSVLLLIKKIRFKKIVFVQWKQRSMGSLLLLNLSARALKLHYCFKSCDQHEAVFFVFDDNESCTLKYFKSVNYVLTKMMIFLF